jgi:rod shape-determining protein MreC
MLELWVRYRRYWLLLGVLLAAGSLLGVQQGRPGDLLGLGEGVAWVTAPLQAALARGHRGAVAVWTNYLDWKGLRADRARLQAEVAGLRLRQLRHDELDGENRRLRELLALRDRLPARVLGAEVVAREWNGFTRGLTINRGRQDGVERLAPVIVTAGVVGRVASVRGSSAVIQVLTDPASSIGGVVQRTRAQGLVEGVAGGRLRLKLSASEEGVRPGDAVVTSGIGELFPKGLLLGRVLRVFPPTGVFRTAELEAAVDLATVEEVLMLPRGTPGDLGPAFTGPDRP